MQDVSWQREERTILQDINWQVEAGQHWCLVGLNGSGKTTLLNMINGYIWPTTGSVTVFGERYGQTDVREVRKRIGWVSPSMMEQLHEHETAERIVLSGKHASIGLYEEPDAADVEKALMLMRTFDCEALMERPYRTLSQGERQKVLIARALMADPRLLILDEPCTGLDLLAREQLLAMIGQIAKQPGGPTLLYVTHHIEEILPCFTHTMLLKAGRIYRSGDARSVLSKEELSRFFGMPLSVRRIDERIWITVENGASFTAHSFVQ
ncbi:ABC transporter ATP-binding protein [Brevibacillus sp. H7]|uniref:ABC transporter ATP-binding protein n=1 Tax=Brevibacillus sp. H7 TaxID=3349138 RepID=UPI0038082BE0